MTQFDSLPDRPLKPVELQAIEQTGDYDLVAPVEWHPTERELPADERIHLVVFVTEDSVTAVNLCENCESWHTAVEGERPEGTAPETCYYSVVSKLREPSGPI
ncbi:MAG: hypothetical protein ABEH56_06645 [Salinirussus sp.]